MTITKVAGRAWEAPPRRLILEGLRMSQKRSASVRSVVRSPPGAARPANRLLAALPAEAYRALSPQLTTVPMPLKHVLHQSGERLRYVYFLNSGVASITTGLSDGRMVEAATVGDEGMLG